ncbi:MAG: ArsR family transcriptional regulator [Candidatus Methanomethyliaceae archaeon]|nr:ArsR family transcriptional regulator [Candidatus Methanomethyliaceae archaeon]MDW7971298.1 ArsR family transcriptional regulator [Nitrososphaerota archaeon]
MANTVLMERILQLRNVDKIIDLSKGTLQLDILLAISSKGEATISDIVEITGQRRKAITDALRKLKNKNLVESSDKKRFRLTQEGERCIKMLAEFLGNSQNIGSIEHGLPDIIPKSSILSQIIIALATSRNNRMTVKEIARAIGLSPQRAQSYIDLYVNRESSFFKKYTDETSISKLLSKLGISSKKYETYYALTKEGFQQFYKMPLYLKMKQSLAYRILSKITFTKNPRLIFRRLNFLFYGLGFASALAMAFNYLIIPWTWAGFSIVITLLVIADLFLYNSFF